MLFFNIILVTFEGPFAMLNKKDQKVNSSSTALSSVELLINSISSSVQKKFCKIKISTDSNESSDSSNTHRHLSELSVIPQENLGIKHHLIFSTLYCTTYGILPT